MWPWKVWRQCVALEEELQERPAEQGAVWSKLMLRVWGVYCPSFGRCSFFIGRHKPRFTVTERKIEAALGFNRNSDTSIPCSVFFFPKLQVKTPKGQQLSILWKYVGTGAHCLLQKRDAIHQLFGGALLFRWRWLAPSCGSVAPSRRDHGVPSQGPCLPALGWAWLLDSCSRGFKQTC